MKADPKNVRTGTYCLDGDVAAGYGALGRQPKQRKHLLVSLPNLERCLFKWRMNLPLFLQSWVRHGLVLKR